MASDVFSVFRKERGGDEKTNSGIWEDFQSLKKKREKWHEKFKVFILSWNKLGKSPPPLYPWPNPIIKQKWHQQSNKTGLQNNLCLPALLHEQSARNRNLIFLPPRRRSWIQNVAANLSMQDLPFENHCHLVNKWELLTENTSLSMHGGSPQVPKSYPFQVDT